MLSVFFTSHQVKDFQRTLKADQKIFRNFFHALFKKGVYFPPSAFESWFLSDSLSFEDLDFTLSMAEEVCKEILQ